MRDMLLIALSLVLEFFAAVVLGVILRFFFDYRFRPGAVDVVSFGGRLRILSIGNVRQAAVMDLLSLDDWCQHLWPFTINIPNRFRRRILVVYTKGTYIYLMTPLDPEMARIALMSGCRRS